mmetsp:Transcript_39295/g.62239  ORF Transcript_39295/g.62239 Transcript_39295/m.62239 type:complete len:249 (-) Transcript_39295:83-829(-)
MTFICEICCPSARPLKKDRRKKSSSPNKDRDSRKLKTFKVPDTILSPDSDNNRDFSPPSDCDPGSASPASASPETSFYYSKSHLPPVDMDDVEKDDVELKRKIKEIKKIAKKIEGPMQKHPKSGKGFFKKVQDRYVAVAPDNELDVPGVNDFMRWKAGTLSWWESGESYRNQATPKGFVPLLKIAKVDISKDDKIGKSVVIKHKHNNEMHELVLIFNNNRDAEEWSYALWEFISLVRGQTASIATFVH